jgi:bifunctional non-homologous end joining protein LigD
MLLRDANRIMPGWLVETKWDGFRSIVRVTSDRVRLWSRHGRDFTELFPELQALSKQCKPGVYDGEIVALDKDGLPHFEWVRSRWHQRSIVLFDVLATSRHTVTARPIEERKALLERMVPLHTNEVLRSVVFADGEALFEQCERLGLEGIVCKKPASPYREAVRSWDWLRLRTTSGRDTIRARGLAFRA